MSETPEQMAERLDNLSSYTTPRNSAACRAGAAALREVAQVRTKPTTWTATTDPSQGPLEQVAEALRQKAEQEQWARWCKDGESPLERMARERRDTQTLLGELAKAKNEVARLRAEVREFIGLANTIYTRDRDGRAGRRLANRRMGELARLIMSCSYGDPSCPCQDGDPCHYEDTADTTAMTPPRPVAERRCNGCGHQWAGPAPVVLCGECWRKLIIAPGKP